MEFPSINTITVRAREPRVGKTHTLSVAKLAPALGGQNYSTSILQMRTSWFYSFIHSFIRHSPSAEDAVVTTSQDPPCRSPGRLGESFLEGQRRKGSCGGR